MAGNDYCPVELQEYLPTQYTCSPIRRTFWDVVAGPLILARGRNVPNEEEIDKTLARTTYRLRLRDGDLFWIAIATPPLLTLPVLLNSSAAGIIAGALTLITTIAFFFRRFFARRARDQARKEKALAQAFKAEMSAFYAAGGRWQEERTQLSWWQVCDPSERGLNGHEFAARVAELLAAFNWSVAIGNHQGVGDYGADILAFDPVSQHRIVIQCKLMDKVEPPMARELAATKCVFDAHRAILVALKKPTEKQIQMHDLGDRFGLEYLDAEDLVRTSTAIHHSRRAGELVLPVESPITRSSNVRQCSFGTSEASRVSKEAA